MGKCIKRLAISVIAAALSLLTLSGPVFATNTSTNSSEQANFSASLNTTLTTFATGTNPDNSNNDNNGDNNNNSENSSETCYDQVGGIGWLICPGTSFLANVIDGAYDILEQLIKVNPISMDDNSPIHVVWTYLRNITNIIFVIFFLVIIYSQITGIGINNYGIKRTLPRIIVAAILVNLSFIVCVLAVDVSNILGVGLRGIFESIQADAIANSTISEAAANTSVAGIVATILGVGTIGTIGALTIAGGWTGLIWLLIPVILSGAIAIISAVVTMAARQALILLLIMISPLAFVAYLLPNTERWYKMWVNMFARMLFFYPMFSVLYGASQLAGLVIITSATNWLGVVLGIAVEVLPLFMSIPLMRMSGTILGRVDGLVRRAGAPIHGAAIRRSTEGRILAKQRQLASTNSYRPSTRLAQYLEQRRVNRKLDTDEAIEAGHKQRIANYNRSMYNRNGQLTHRGLTRYQNIQRNIEADNVVTTTAIDFDEGFKDDGTDSRVRTRHLNAIAATNAALVRNVDSTAINKARQRSVDLENTRSRAERIREGVKDQHSEIHRQITSAFNLPNESTDPNERLAIQKSINATLSDAITDSRKVDKIARDSYYELYDDMPAGNGPQNKLIEAIAEKDYNSMTAAISVMAKRGDYRDIERTLYEHSGEILNDMRMQKQLGDELITKKAEDQILWAYAKANMIRRGMYTNAVSEGKDPKMAPFIDFKTFIAGAQAQGDKVGKDDAKWLATSLDKILEDVKGPGTTATQDRTVFKAMLEFMQDGAMSTDTLHIPMKYIRSAAVSGMMDGEQLGTLNKYITFGYDKKSMKPEERAFFDANKENIKLNIQSFFKDMAASQLVNIKSSTFNALNDAMLEIDPGSATTSTTGDPNRPVSQLILDALQNQITSVNKPNYTARGGMNPAVREMLGIATDM